MSKAPPNTPEVGDLVRLRGNPNNSFGILGQLDRSTLWAAVRWDEKMPSGPQVCHLYELVKIVKPCNCYGQTGQFEMEQFPHDMGIPGCRHA